MSKSLVRQNFHDDSENAINKHVNLEMYTAYTYVSMSCYYAREGLSFPGMYNFYVNLQSRYFERVKKWLCYMDKRGGRLEFKEIAKPATDNWGSVLDGFEKTLELERTIYQSLLDIHKEADKYNDAHLAHYIEDEYLDESAVRIKDLADKISQLRRINSGLGEFVFDLKLLKQHGSLRAYFHGHEDAGSKQPTNPVTIYHQSPTNIDVDKILQNLSIDKVAEFFAGGPTGNIVENVLKSIL